MRQKVGWKQPRMTAMITGAAGGLGKSFAVECASRGWDLFLTDMPGSALETLAARQRSGYGVRVGVEVCDLTDSAQRDQLVERIRLAGVRPNFLINVAGVDFEGMFCDQSTAHIQTIVRLNVEATLALTHAVLRWRDADAPLWIINVASLAAFYPMPVKATYAASKRFLLDFSLALRQELRDQNASVTVLCPAGMPTSAECIRAIEAQGWAGQLTTRDVGRVANETLNAALRGKAVVVPGAVNRLIQAIGSLMPPEWVASWIGRRWRGVREERAAAGGLVLARD